jgi:TetR/AcrR family transcriptional regulator, regulator of autoinduction and epiphytic fitness
MDTTDGRKARSERTRSAVAEAMLDCLQEGILRPSAKEVAERAAVSTRAVFRHFDNMDSLFEQVGDLQIERVERQLPIIVEEGTLDARIQSLVVHSIARNQITAPVRRAAILTEPYSKQLRERYAWFRSVLRRQVRTSFAAELDALSETARRDMVAAVAALLSFGYWDELKTHEKISSVATRRVLCSTIKGLFQ